MPASQPDTGVRANQPTHTSPRVPTDAPPRTVSLLEGARLDGFGPLRLGMNIAQAERAWPGLFDGMPRPSPDACFFANGGDRGVPYFAFMFDGGRFVRYGGTNDDIAAPGGGMRGMHVDRLQALYRGSLQREPDHERPDGPGYRLFHHASGVAPSKLVFVIDVRQRVAEWYVGIAQQVDYTRGCDRSR